MFGPNSAVPEHGQCEPQMWATAAAETVKITAKGIRLVQKRMQDRGIQLCMPVDKLLDVLVQIFLCSTKVIKSSDLSSSLCMLAI